MSKVVTGGLERRWQAWTWYNLLKESDVYSRHLSSCACEEASHCVWKYSQFLRHLNNVFHLCQRWLSGLEELLCPKSLNVEIS